MPLSPLVLDEWYVVSLSRDLTSDQRLKTRLLGNDIFLARGEDRTAIGMRATGGGKPIQVFERYGYVWASLGEPDHDLFTLPEYDDARGRRFIPWGAIGVHTSSPRAVENFLDLAHFPFVHTGTLGGTSDTEVPDYKIEKRNDGRELWAIDCRFFQPQAGASASGGLDIVYHYRVPMPFVAILYKTSSIETHLEDVIGLYIQPVEEERCICHGFCHVLDDEDASETSSLHFHQGTFAQDRPVLQTQRPRRLPLDLAAEMPTRCDRMSVAYRRWLKAMGLTYGVLTAA